MIVMCIFIQSSIPELLDWLQILAIVVSDAGNIGVQMSFIHFKLGPLEHIPKNKHAGSRFDLHYLTATDFST